MTFNENIQTHTLKETVNWFCKDSKKMNFIVNEKENNEIGNA